MFHITVEHLAETFGKNKMSHRDKSWELYCDERKEETKNERKIGRMKERKIARTSKHVPYNAEQEGRKETGTERWWMQGREAEQMFTILQRNKE